MPSVAHFSACALITFSAEPPAMYGDAVAAGAVKRGDALRIALLDGEDNKFLHPVDEIIGFLAGT